MPHPSPGSSAAVPVLTRRCARPDPPPSGRTDLRLALAADERTRLRGRRRCVEGTEVLLQLERTVPLRPGEWLGTGDGLLWVQVQAAIEPLLRVRGAPLALMRAAYHLGNRHVALEVTDTQLTLLADGVLEAMLQGLGVQVERSQGPFAPEPGAYGSAGLHSYRHPHSHSHAPVPPEPQP
ncbi:urease accessory protein UreE [Synechococcus sp. RSCCF101]|uniref:urease accessory protein UreE n=1 Tax=Synechococcus sp. RSCCF101 TaxID=2511069 RepID=UPI001248903F|nr:urease accessory protein UreE [Synechococcus sp. RSCCF101]QEY32636.1 urease accessory protein UreE [Synechococcus sp. RSCCF101]